VLTVVKNVDDYLLAPLGRSLFQWNMQFSDNPQIKGDLEVKARGTESLMANEVRSQRLLQFLQIGSNPVLAPFMKSDYIIREIAKSMDLDPDLVTNNLADAAIQAEIMKQFAPPQVQQQTPGGPPAVEGITPSGPEDPTNTGNGNIAAGGVPQPGEQGFSGNPPQQ